MAAIATSPNAQQAPLTSLPALLRASASDASSTPLPDDIEDANSSAHAQLLAFTSQSLNDLRAQPDVLKSQATSLDTQLSTLCSRHVHSFVRVRSATSALPDALDRLDERLDALLEHDLPALSQAAGAFSQRVQQSMTAKDRARNLLEQYELSLKDLLDIPRLLMTCARANHPIEALQLGTHIAKIAASSQATNDRTSDERSVLLKALKRECWSHLLRLREDLLRGLGARGVRLPAARRYVSLLARLRDVDQAGKDGSSSSSKDAVEEPLTISASAICLSFLRSRWILVEEIGAHETDDEAHTLLSSHISSWRDVVGDTITIALALFASPNTTQAIQDEPSPLSLISSFGYRSIGKLDQLVARQIPRLDVSKGTLRDAFETLDSLHTQLSYAASALSRQGLDFSEVSQARSEFEKQAILIWSRGIKAAVDTLDANLQSSSNILSVKELIGHLDAQSLLEQEMEQIQTSNDWSREAAHFPCLARFTNDLLDAQEALLSFAPVSIGERAVHALDSALHDVIAQALDSFCKAEQDPHATSRDIRIATLLQGGAASEEDQSALRLHRATIAVAARYMTVLCSVVLPAIRGLLCDTFQIEQRPSSSLEDVLNKVSTWAQSADVKWAESERDGKARAQEQLQQRLAAEEARREAEAERRRAAEAERKEQMRLQEERQQREAREAEIARRETEKRRKEEEERRKEEEAHRREEDERRRAAEKAQRERQRQAQEEAEQRRKKEEEEERIRKEAEEVDRARKEEEAQRLRREAEEAERELKEAEAERLRKAKKDEERLRKEAEEEEQRLRVAEETRKRQEKEAELQHLEEESKRRREAEEEHQRQIDREKEERKVAEEAESARAREPTGIVSDEREVGLAAGEAEVHPERSEDEKDGDVNSSKVVANEAQSGKEQSSIPSTMSVGQENDASLIYKGAQSREPKQARGPTFDVQAEAGNNVPGGAGQDDAERPLKDTSQVLESKEHAVPDERAAEIGRATEEEPQELPAPTPAPNKLAEKLRKRQEQRAKAAAAAASKANAGG